ncbi:hypothetical protein [Streptomyces synnematoformans]|uniref:Radical SAM protein n=1 Tax=Streptomyces synnematoformans TaxID=415721 RepID=A0ABN2YH19_9ACTN
MHTVPLRFAWLEVTGRCNESCGHCYADSGPQGTHGTMTVPDWERTIRQLAEIGALDVQFIGGNVRRTALADIWTGPRMAAIGREIRDAHGAGAASCTPPQFLPMCGPCGPCVPSVGHCDPRATDSIGSPG